MSFFASQTKNSNQPLKTQLKIGPGHYDISNTKQNSYQTSYAPFGSLQRKNKPNRSNALGPGQYEIRGQIIKPSIKKYQNNNCIIIKINEEGWSQFKSKINRFQDKDINNSKTPGPGQYSPQRKILKTQIPKLKSDVGQKIKEINVKIYNQRRKPTLFSDIKQIAKDQQTPKKEKVKGTSWSLNKKQRFSPIQKQKFTQQHKQQLINKFKQQKVKNRSKSQSAVFASKSLKSEMEQQIYQSSNPFKVQLRKIIEFKDQRPGPGAYDCHNQFFNPKKYNKHQFFGSTVQRFHTNGQKYQQYLGPGYYQPKFYQNQDKKNKRKLTIDTEASQVDRYSYLPTDGNIPGPGSYSLNQKKRNKTSCKWVFGSKNPRFQKEKKLFQNQQQFDQNQLQRQFRKQKQYQFRKQFLNHRKSSNFISSSKRFQQQKQATQKIQIGMYDLTKTDIGQKLRRAIKKQQQTGRHNHRLESHPFSSSIERFQQKTQKQAQSHDDCWCLVKSVQKHVYLHQSSSFSSKDKRIVVFENKSSRQTPGVGTYSKQSSFVKGSFNSKFLSANEARTKKIKMWNTQKQLTQLQKQQPMNGLKIN